MRRVLLFISSYVPLYILLVAKNILERCTAGGRFDLSWERIISAHYFDEVNDYAIVVLLLLTLISASYLVYLTKRSLGGHSYKVVRVEDQTGNIYFNYISIYLLSCMGLTLNSIVDVFVLFFLMVIVGYIYIFNHMTYMNPTLQVLGYKVYEGTLLSQSTNQELQTIIIAPGNIPVIKDTSYRGSGKEDFVCITSACDN